MPRSSASLEQLFDRSWRPGHPLRPRLSPVRRWGMFSLLCFLMSVIASYWYLTDATRVRRMCESYLSQLVGGGQVEVRHAALSIFEGLRLDGVSVKVDKGGAFDSTLFDVQTVLIKYNPESILSGKLVATEIVAIDPRVRLCENVDTRKWNYQRMVLPQQPSTSQPAKRAMVLPQLKMRNGQVDYSQIVDGRLVPAGTLAVDGSLTPGEGDGAYVFRIQSRGGSDALGPVVSGEFVSGTREVTARLENFEFGPDIKAMLPDVVRQWWEDHHLAGHVDIPNFHIVPGGPGRKATFRVETELHNVNLAVSPNEWLSRAERDQLTALHGAFDLMRVAGLNRASATAARQDGRAGPSGEAFVDRLERTVTPPLIGLENVAGTFVFTQDGIDLQHVSGTVEGNAFNIAGRIDGYNADAAARVEVRGKRLYVPHAPQFVNAMPRVMREVYETFKPEGTCGVRVSMIRPAGGKRPQVDGEVELIDGRFVFDQFAYPLRHVSGTIRFGPDAVRGDRLDLVDIRGYGVENGPNRDRFITINGSASPINADAEVRVRIETEDVIGEPAIRAALPKEGQEALKALDPTGTGEYPKWRGHVVADVTRELGPRKPYNVLVTIDLAEASGAFEAFPYPLEGITGRVIVGMDHVTLSKFAAKKGDASVVLDGDIRWGKEMPLTPEVKITARNVPIDATLMKAVQPDRRAWIERLGVGGKLDVDGRVFLRERKAPVVLADAGEAEAAAATTRPATEIDVALDMRVREGTLCPTGTSFVVSNVDGRLRMADGGVAIRDFTGRRGEADLAVSGNVGWGAGEPTLSLTGSAKNLLLEPALYEMLPKPAREAWDEVRPRGTVDVAMSYGAPEGAGGASPPMATTRPSTQPSAYEVTLWPRRLGVTATALPYALEGLSGTITVTPAGTTLRDVVGHHGKAAVRIGGTCDGGDAAAASGAARNLQLHVTGSDVPVDEDLLRALPKGLSDLMRSMKLKGTLAFDFPSLSYRPSPIPKGDADLDLNGSVWFAGASMDAGVPLADVNGQMRLTAGVRAGKLGSLRGTVRAPTMTIAGRPAKDFYAELFKPERQDAMRLEKMQASLAGGELAGQVDVAFPDNAASRFAVGLVLRNADVTQLTSDKDSGIRGQLTASLALEGAWNDTASRRGRGDVTVVGRDMYHIPLVLGLMQITNLSLPLTSPFNEANARYLVEGQKVNFEQIELRASNMIMQGNGSLDYGTRKVHMTFTTDNPNWPKLPFVDELLKGAKHELLQIHVNGTVQEPKVSGSVMNTFTTTVDEVFKAGDGSGGRRKK